MAQSLTKVQGIEIEPAPVADASEQQLDVFQPQALAVEVAGDESQPLAFMPHFASNPAAVEALQAEASKQLPVLFANHSTIINYGMDALADVIATTKEVLELTKDVQLPENEDAQLKSLAVQIGKAGQYDMSVAENVAKYNEMKSKLTSFLGKSKARAYFETFKADRQTLDELTNEIAGDLTKRAINRALMANVSNKLYTKNQDSLLLLAERCAVLEEIIRMSEEQRAQYPAQLATTDPDFEKVNAIDTFIRLVRVKYVEFAGRWFTGMALAPMLRAQQEQHVNMAMKLQLSATVGMEKVRLILGQYAMSLSLKNDVDTLKAFDDFSNDMTQKMFQNTRATVAEVARATTSASMTTETITVIAHEAANIIGDVQQAYANARQEQAAQLAAMGEAVNIIEQSQNRPINVEKVGELVSMGRQSGAKSLTTR